MTDQRLPGLLMQGMKGVYAASWEEPGGKAREDARSREAGEAEASARSTAPGRVQRWYSWLVSLGFPSR